MTLQEEELKNVCSKQKFGTVFDRKAKKILYENADYNPIYFRSTESLQNPSLKGLVRNSTGLSVDFTYAYKE